MSLWFHCAALFCQIFVFGRIIDELIFLSCAKFFNDSSQKSSSISTRKKNFFARLATSEKSKNFSFFFSRFDDDVPLVRVVVLAARGRPGYLGEGELPVNWPVAENTLQVYKRQNLFKKLTIRTRLWKVTKMPCHATNCQIWQHC